MIFKKLRAKTLSIGRRYQQPEGSEAEYQPGSGRRVLRNNLGIFRKREIDEYEHDLLIAAQQKLLKAIDSDTRFNAAMLCKMHKDWLGSLYPWAGRYRTLDLSKAGFTWPPAFRVMDNMRIFENGVLRDLTPCLPGALPKVALNLARVHAELLFIHPFRDGNGRLARWLADVMAIQAGYPPPQYNFTGRGAVKRHQSYVLAVQQGYVLNYDPLSVFFLEALERSVLTESKSGFGNLAPSNTDDS